MSTDELKFGRHIHVTKDTMDLVMKAVEELTKKEVVIGITAENDARNDGGDFGNAAIGYLNEFGSPLNNIPPRPHLIPGIERSASRAVETGLKVAGLGALEGKQEKVRAGFAAAGQICADGVRLMITDGLSPPLKPSTIAARKHKGFKGTHPLIMTGDYFNHITFAVRDK